MGSPSTPRILRPNVYNSWPLKLMLLIGLLMNTVSAYATREICQYGFTSKSSSRSVIPSDHLRAYKALVQQVADFINAQLMYGEKRVYSGQENPIPEFITLSENILSSYDLPSDALVDISGPLRTLLLIFASRPDNPNRCLFKVVSENGTEVDFSENWNSREAGILKLYDLFFRQSSDLTHTSAAYNSLGEALSKLTLNHRISQNLALDIVEEIQLTSLHQFEGELRQYASLAFLDSFRKVIGNKSYKLKLSQFLQELENDHIKSPRGIIIKLLVLHMDSSTLDYKTADLIWSAMKRSDQLSKYRIGEWQSGVRDSSIPQSKKSALLERADNQLARIKD